MEVAVPVDRTAPKIIKPNEISIRTASQNNCEPELLRPFASKVHIGTDGNLVISKPNFIDMNKLFIKDNPNIELQNIVDPLELNQKYQPSTSLLTAKVNGSNTMLLIMSNSVVKHEVPDQSDVIVKKKEAAADGDTHQPVITMKQEETIADEHNVPIRSQQQTSHSIQVVVIIDGFMDNDTWSSY
ncbi:hypothetical protein EVAR_52109_1 [Eumeta japonica]|uniref:Uncharacterized protein n=1 Tax=Eumeta variegata TaxID=151549 RepID=A0A4C1XSZ7_EUMVA|nr:hypothetical protein EVAR_52109_1 [Eumeta japonica]